MMRWRPKAEGAGEEGQERFEVALRAVLDASRKGESRFPLCRVGGGGFASGHSDPKWDLTYVY
jgi:hypothetical protein